jgi:hypothetical protein
LAVFATRQGFFAVLLITSRNLPSSPPRERPLPENTKRRPAGLTRSRRGVNIIFRVTLYQRCKMLKRELFELLEDVPDDAEVYILGADVRVVVHSPEGNNVVLDEKGYPFKDGIQDGYYRILFDPEGQLSDANAAWN